MKKLQGLAAAAAGLLLAAPGWSASISGKVVNSSGKPQEGVTVSAIDSEREMSVSVFSQADGSFKIDGLRDATFNVRGRLLGDLDVTQEGVKPGATDVALKMAPATGDALNLQRTADNLFGLMKWESEDDKQNFKMSCGYCHQIGTIGFRSPEEPVDWETMITRMDGFGGLYKHTQETVVNRIVNTYTDKAMKEWPAFVPPPAPTGAATKATITEWDVGRQDACMIHDLELGKNGLVYAVDMINDCIYSLDTNTGERKVIAIDGGKDPNADTNPRKGPHSVEADHDGNLWITLALSGQMGKYDVTTGKFTIVSSAPAPRPRGAYPHTLRVQTDLAKDPKGRVWYTDAASDVFSLDPTTNEVVQYPLPKEGEVASGGRGESRGRTPYGVSISPVDGTVWYTKLNGNRVGRIDPSLPPTEAVKEWEPPFRGPRRLEVGPDGIVWVPGFASGVLGRFDPKTEKWDIIDLPNKVDEIPYALSVDQKKNLVWICGTMSDSMLRYNPKNKELVEYRMPSRVTYTREVEFGDDGSVWVCNSNYPVRHTERGRGSIIKIVTAD